MFLEDNIKNKLFVINLEFLASLLVVVLPSVLPSELKPLVDPGGADPLGTHCLEIRESHF